MRRDVAHRQGIEQIERSSSLSDRAAHTPGPIVEIVTSSMTREALPSGAIMRELASVTHNLAIAVHNYLLTSNYLAHSHVNSTPLIHDVNDSLRYPVINSHSQIINVTRFRQFCVWFGDKPEHCLVKFVPSFFLPRHGLPPFVSARTTILSNYPEWGS
ncbi:MAG: hypothetical protein ACHQAQ_17440, partial [Hyphomicrobiales bacterium]